MTKKELEAYKLSKIDAYGGAPWRLFIVEMKDRQYGYDAARDAWAWFLTGYTAHIRGPR